MRNLQEMVAMWEKANKVASDQDFEADEVAQAVADAIRWCMEEETPDYIVRDHIEE